MQQIHTRDCIPGRYVWQDSVVKALPLRYNQAMQTEPNWGMLGHEWAVDLLRGHLANQRTRHAYLITGPQGVGRRTLAMRMTQGLNCLQPVGPGEPCRTCHTCQRIERMQHPDLSVVQAEQVGGTLKIDQVRELQRGLSLAPYEAPYKVALLLRFEEANLNAANALLKTLEEPASQVVLFVTAQDAETLLPTLVSRCEIIRLHPLPIEKTSAGLQTLWELPPEQADLFAHISNGRPGFALQLHQNPERLEQRQSWLDSHQQLLNAKRVERFQFAEELAKDKPAMLDLLQTWLLLWRDVLLRASGAATPLTNPDCQADVDRLAESFGLTTAREMIATLERAQTLLDHNANTRLTAEVLMLNLPHIS
jgi:DNA polymerase-3 subunit delta'